MKDREKALRLRCRENFIFFAQACLKIVNKEGKIIPLKFNAAQHYLHKRLEEQKERTGKVRAIILKGRQQGASTYTEARFYHRVIHSKGLKSYILTHSKEATTNIFTMVERYHEKNNPLLKPHVGAKNATEFVFDRLDSRYNVSTAGAKGAGRSATIHLFHGSEVAFWDNADEHAAGALQAVPDVPGTEIILESTANGTGNKFHEIWQEAESGSSEYQAIFIPWFWQPEYAKAVPDDFEVDNNPENSPEGELTEWEYQQAYGLTDEQIFWRRMKIKDLGFWKFKQEYPATAAEAFQSSGEASYIPLKSIIKARKSGVTSPAPVVVGVDPAGGGSDRTAIIRRCGRKAYNLQTFSKMESMQIVAMLHRIIMEEKPDKMFIDLGYNPGIHDRLKELKGTQGVVVGINFGSSALDPTKYKNKRAEMWDLMKQWLDDEGGANIPDDDELQSDLLAPKEGVGFTWMDSNNILKIESKQSMKKRKIRSPDTADALALTFALPVRFNNGTSMIGNANADFSVF